jgi:hypothetical protein
MKIRSVFLAFSRTQNCSTSLIYYRYEEEEDITKEINRRLAIAPQKLGQMKKIWQGTDRSIKLKFLRALIFPIAIFGCESWTLILAK